MKYRMGMLVALPLGALLVACGGAQSGAESTPATEATNGDANEASPIEGEASSGGSSKKGDREFDTRTSDSAGDAHGASETKIKATKTEAAMRLFILDKESNEPITGIVISLTNAAGQKFYTSETDVTGYGEVLVPVNHEYELVYLSLGRRTVNAKVKVSDEPNQDIKLTLRYKPRGAKPVDASGPSGFVLDGVEFDTGKATIRPESFARLDGVLEYLLHKKSAKIEISGHTDNVGKPETNKALSLKRAQACRDYLVSKGVEASRIEASGYGDEQPIAPNDSPENRQKNRRIEAKEL